MVGSGYEARKYLTGTVCLHRSSTTFFMAVGSYKSSRKIIVLNYSALRSYILYSRFLQLMLQQKFLGVLVPLMDLLNNHSREGRFFISENIPDEVF